VRNAHRRLTRLPPSRPNCLPPLPQSGYRPGNARTPGATRWFFFCRAIRRPRTAAAKGKPGRTAEPRQQIPRPVPIRPGPRAYAEAKQGILQDGQRANTLFEHAPWRLFHLGTKPQQKTIAAALHSRHQRQPIEENTMKTKQLANILIKVLGLYFLLTGIPDILVLIGQLIVSVFSAGTGMPSGAAGWFWLCEPAIQFVFGMILIVRSRKVTEFLFKDDGD
jgi:hypothetical protein